MPCNYTITGSSLMIKLSDRLNKKISKVFQVYEMLVNNKRRVQYLRTNCCICFTFLLSWWTGSIMRKKDTLTEKDYMEAIAV